jgi:hypothetical protein
MVEKKTAYNQVDKHNNNRINLTPPHVIVIKVMDFDVGILGSASTDNFCL